MVTTCILAFAFSPPAFARHAEKQAHTKHYAQDASASKHIASERSSARRHRIAAIHPRHERGKRTGGTHVASLIHRHGSLGSRHGRFAAARNRTLQEARVGGSIGVASYYSASGMTAAHRSLPFGTRVRVTNLANGHTVVVRINDRGPFIRGRSIDLSAGAARAIGMTGAGVARVRMHVI
ncbi:MAG: septal ring lytic transglycosylase RlpA family protein [Hyphomicrobiales bacterium]|nr:septal ring lytic transglycosylase RlpA family protein [Hyphomicrobiales bacterium]